MAPVQDAPHGFTSHTGIERRRSINVCNEAERWSGIAIAPLYIGAAAHQIDKHTVEIGLSVHDGTYSIDFCIHRVTPADSETLAQALQRNAKNTIMSFAKEHHGKFVGAGITTHIATLCPDMPAFLWRELDVVTMVFDVQSTMPKFAFPHDGAEKETRTISVDEQADSAARKCLKFFGPHNQPMLDIGFRNKVEVDCAGRAELVHSVNEYRETVSPETWECVTALAKELKKNDTKIAFFSATPQGGGVALMRHALIRFFRLIDVACNWYIPKPSPKVFRVTKNNHNILQGVEKPEVRFGPEQQAMMNDWITYNANRYWLAEGGPLAEGGCDVAIIDDPQMPGLIPLIKKARPDVKIIFRSHIEIRSDLIHKAGSKQEEVWKYLWERIKPADVFISHPVNKFVPTDVPMDMVALMPATTDWLDGLNKDMQDWDLRYYHHQFRNSCLDIGMNLLCYPDRDYVAQIARFDPSKGIPDVLEGYRKMREIYAKKSPNKSTPQLLVCGHGAIDDPDASIIYDETIKQIDGPEYEDIREDIVVMRVGPSDQILNALISTAKVVLQLSSREGFEVKVSEALHKGKPVIASRAGGIPLQVQDKKNGFLVDVNDSDAVAEHLYTLTTDEDLYRKMGDYAKRSVSDEVSTVGNAAAWMYLANKLAEGEEVKPKAEWVADMYREEVGLPYKEGETRLPREGIEIKGSTH